MESQRLRASYDAVPYTSRSVPQSHPDRLHVLARLHGLQPAAVTNCRVLELGSASGGNLLPMAAQLPGSNFVGIDLSERQTGMARSAAEALGLDNLLCLTADVLDPTLPERLGSFDYIIAHGLYSWVPASVQRALPAVIAALLAPDGIAYVSYNTHPGWQQRGIVRRFLLDAVDGLDDPTERAVQARTALELLSDTQLAGGAYAAFLAEETARVATMDDSFLLHDLMEAENRPVWFADFAAAMAGAGLCYVSESNLSASRLENFPPQQRLILAQSVDPLSREQRIDFWLNRCLRESLLCHDRHALERGLLPDRIGGLWATTALHPEANGDPTEGVEVFYATPAGVRIGLRAEAAKQAMDAMAADAPLFVNVDTMLARSRQPGLVIQLLFDLYCRNLVDLSPRQPPYVLHAGAHPEASALARWQTASGDIVTNQRHQTVTLDDPQVARLLPLLDGRRGRGVLAALFDGNPHGLDQALDALARQALLVA